MKIGTARSKRTWRVKKLGDWVRFSDICKWLTIKSDCALRNSTKVSWTLISLVYKNSTQRNFTCTYSVIERYLFVMDVATPPSKTVRSAVRVREGQDHRDDGSCVVNSASNQPRRPFHHSWPADKSEVEYTSRRPSSGRFHQINSSKDRHIIRQARVDLTSSLSTIQTDTTFTTSPCICPYRCKAPFRKTFGIASPIICATNDTHPLSPSFGVVSRSTGLDRNRMEPRCFQRQIKIEFG